MDIYRNAQASEQRHYCHLLSSTVIYCHFKIDTQRDGTSAGQQV